MGGNNAPAQTGYRIMSVDQGSPMSAFDIEPMLDFIVYPESDASPSLMFETFIEHNENKEIELVLYNMITRLRRKIKVVPRKWEGKGLLGSTVRLEEYPNAHARVMRVLNIYVNSPLHKAGFRPKVDYILGTADRGFEKIEEFTAFVRDNNLKPIPFIVFNSEDRSIRTVSVTPNDRWGGSGYLGGNIGFGELNCIPNKVASSPASPVETAEGQERSTPSGPESAQRSQQDEKQNTGMGTHAETLKTPVGVDVSEILLGNTGQSKDASGETHSEPKESALIVSAASQSQP